MKFICPLLVVDDIQKSRDFYEKVLSQNVKFDFGENITFQGDFAIHLKAHYQKLLNDKNHSYSVCAKAHNFELYFETDHLDEVQSAVEKAGVEFIHPVREQPWGQRVMRVMRFYDPDGHILEVGETLEAVAKKFLSAGMSAEKAAERMGMPLAFVKQVQDAGQNR